jgi:hypothetical protein
MSWHTFLGIVAVVSWFDATIRSVATFATNDYRPILIRALVSAVIYGACATLLFRSLGSRWRLLLLLPSAPLALLVLDDIGRILAVEAGR